MIYAAFQTRKQDGKGFIPKPSKTAFYSATDIPKLHPHKGGARWPFVGCRAPSFLRLFFHAHFRRNAFPVAYEPVHRKRDIPRGAEQPPYQNDAADKSAQNEVEGDDAYRSGNVKAMRHKPYEHTANTERNTAAQPHIKVVRFAIFRKYVFEHGEKEQRENNGQNGFLEKVFPYFSACHNITPFLTEIAG